MSKFHCTLRPVRKEIVSSMYSNIINVTLGTAVIDTDLLSVISHPAVLRNINDSLCN